MRTDPLSPRLRCNLELKWTKILPERPNLAHPAAVPTRNSLGYLWRGASPPCLGFGFDSAQVPHVLAPFLPTSVAILSWKGPKYCLNAITRPAQRHSSHALIRATSDAVRLVPPLDLTKVPATWAVSITTLTLTLETLTLANPNLPPASQWRAPTGRAPTGRAALCLHPESSLLDLALTLKTLTLETVTLTLTYPNLRAAGQWQDPTGRAALCLHQQVGQVLDLS